MANSFKTMDRNENEYDKIKNTKQYNGHIQPAMMVNV